VPLREKRREDPRRRVGERHGESTADEREQQTFGEQLPNEPGSACADRDARGQLTLASGRPSEQHTHDVGAGDEQHDPRQCEQGRADLVESARQSARSG
jgi:hypothetical protein